MKKKSNSVRINTNGLMGQSSFAGKYTTRHIGGIWRWTACNPGGDINEGLAANETEAANAAKKWLGLEGV